MSQGYRYRPPGAKRTGRLQNREVAEAAALRENLKKRKAQSRAQTLGEGAGSVAAQVDLNDPSSPPDPPIASPTAKA